MRGIDMFREIYRRPTGESLLPDTEARKYLIQDVFVCDFAGGANCRRACYRPNKSLKHIILLVKHVVMSGCFNGPLNLYKRALKVRYLRILVIADRRSAEICKKVCVHSQFNR